MLEIYAKMESRASVRKFRFYAILLRLELSYATMLGGIMEIAII